MHLRRVNMRSDKASLYELDASSIIYGNCKVHLMCFFTLRLAEKARNASYLFLFIYLFICVKRKSAHRKRRK